MYPSSILAAECVNIVNIYTKQRILPIYRTIPALCGIGSFEHQFTPAVENAEVVELDNAVGRIDKANVRRLLSGLAPFGAKAFGNVRLAQVVRIITVSTSIHPAVSLTSR